MLVKLPQLQSSQRITPKDTGIVHCKVRFPKIMRGSVSWPFLFQKKMLFIIPSVCWWNLRFRWCNCHFGCLDNILTSLNQFIACTGKQKITFFKWFSPGDILSDIYSDVLSGILSGILSHMYSDILSALLRRHAISHIFWCSNWRSIWHIFSHSFWHSLWHSIWHIFGHSIWHPVRHSIWHIFWHSIWHSCWHSI